MVDNPKVIIPKTRGEWNRAVWALVQRGGAIGPQQMEVLIVTGNRLMRGEELLILKELIRAEPLYTKAGVIGEDLKNTKVSDPKLRNELLNNVADKLSLLADEVTQYVKETLKR